MRDSRDRWVFFQHESRPTLSAADVIYWKNTFKKILKVGNEFEFNLPEQRGTCKGDSISCPCVYMDGNCWKACLKFEDCSIPNVNRCRNKTPECKEGSCANCEKYELSCMNIFCPDFESTCMTCGSFEVNCEKCPDIYDAKNNPNEIRNYVQNELEPSQCYGIINKCGVHSITRDGSLLGDKGMEVITVGRRVDYWEFYSMVKKIIDTSVAKGAYMNERCSTHMHLLASYYGKIVDPKRQHNEFKLPGVPANISELEREVPEIILANFHQLCRRYQNAMTWMTMALDDPKHMTRWEKFRVSILDISAILNDMKTIQRLVRHNSSQGNQAGNKYGIVNYEGCLFGIGGNLSRFHVEMRVADGILCPSAVAALACMYYALAIKAVEISRYGILEVGDDEWLKSAMEIKGAILNNMKDYNANDRFGDTSILHRYYDTLRVESLELCRQLKHILIRIGPAFNILEKLAERPIALRRCDGEAWEKIEKDLEEGMTEENIFETKVNEFIDMRLIDECSTVEEWVKAVSSSIKSEEMIDTRDMDVEQRIAAYIDAKRNDGELIWSSKLGAVVSV